MSRSAIPHDFLQECHETLSIQFNNSKKLPESFKSKYKNFSATELERAWSTYLKVKFQYLLLLDEFSTDKSTTRADQTIDEVIKKSNREYLRRYIKDWKKQAHAEQVAYILRVSQLPMKEVHTQWYDQRVDECKKWCIAQDQKLASFEDEVEKCVKDKRIPDMFKINLTSSSKNISEERRLDIITKIAIQGSANRIFNVQRGWSIPPPNIDVSEQSNSKQLNQDYEQFSRNLDHSFTNEIDLPLLNESCPFEHNFLLNLHLELMTSLISQGFDDTEVIRQFLHRIKNKFECEICDYLDVDATKTKLVWRAATLHFDDLSPKYQDLLLKEEMVNIKVQEKESYTKGQGITGSILLLDPIKGKDMWYHIGSNDVPKDPRQSKKHVSAYQKNMYPKALRVSNGKIKNFWAFPIYDGTRMIGAFRVVNKFDNSGERIINWTYTTRVQLSIIADWFSKFFETVKPYLQTSEDFRVILRRDKDFGDLSTKLKLDWIPDKSKLRGFLRHLSRDISKKQEHRNVGCCIFIVKEVEGQAILEEEGKTALESYPLIATVPKEVTYPYDKLDNYHDAVNPLRGAFAFNECGDFERIVKLEAGGLRGVEAIEKITEEYPKSLCLLLKRGAKNILIYMNGRRAAEINISEGTGEWQFRDPNDLLERMKKGAPRANPEVLELIRDACLEMSNNAFGGLFVIGDINEPDKLFKLGSKKMDYLYNVTDVRSLGVAALVEFAKIDGATFIDNQGKIQNINVTVRAKEAPKRTLFQGRGARHEAGETISKRVREALVVIVSENRGISVVYNGGDAVFENL